MFLKVSVTAEQLGRHLLRRLGRRIAVQARTADDRGDVNGYVFVTLMTAGIVMVIWVVARDRLSEVFDRAITSVTGP
jgi:hypothetical protein